MALRRTAACLILLSCASAQSPYYLPAPALIGFRFQYPDWRFDLNCDGVVDIADFSLAVAQVLGQAPCNTADFNSDGICNIVDLQIWMTAWANGAAPGAVAAGGYGISFTRGQPYQAWCVAQQPAYAARNRTPAQ